MTAWGTGSGFILAIAYMIIVSDIMATINGGYVPLGIIFNPFVWYLGFGFGTIPGAVLGAINGLTLSWMMRTVSLPFTKTHIHNKRLQVYCVIGILTFNLFLIFINILFMLNMRVGTSSETVFFLGIPIIIATIAAIYAAHRYLLRLHQWSNFIDTRKSKAKNDDLHSEQVS